MTSEDGPVIPDPSQQIVLWPTSVAVLRDNDPSGPNGTDELVVPCARTVRGNSGATLDFTYQGDVYCGLHGHSQWSATARGLLRGYPGQTLTNTRSSGVRPPRIMTRGFLRVWDSRQGQ